MVFVCYFIGVSLILPIFTLPQLLVDGEILSLPLAIIMAVIGVLLIRHGNKLHNRNKEAQIFKKYLYLIFHERIMSISLLANYMKTSKEESLRALERMIEKGVLEDSSIDYDNMIINVPAVQEQMKAEEEVIRN